MFAGIYLRLDRLNVMQLSSPSSAILSAVMFNALIIVTLIPLALRGVPYRPSSAVSLPQHNLLIYGIGGIITPFVGIFLIDRSVSSQGSNADHIAPPVRGGPADAAGDDRVTGAYPFAIYGVSRILGLHAKAEGSLVARDGQMAGSELIGIDPVASGSRDLYFHTRPSASSKGVLGPGDPSVFGGSNLAGDSPDLLDAVRGGAD
jgi:K+-transporting ATPase, c chain